MKSKTLKICEAARGNPGLDVALEKIKHNQAIHTGDAEAIANSSPIPPLRRPGRERTIALGRGGASSHVQLITSQISRTSASVTRQCVGSSSTSRPARSASGQGMVRE